jgi:peptide/nickel transport system permease protein
MVFVLIGISAHPVWIGLLFAYFFGFKAGLFPITGYADFFAHSGDTSAGPVQWAYHLVLPWATFAILFAALYVRMIRANVMETLNEDYVRTARAKGLPEHTVITRHGLRAALTPIVTIFGLDLGGLLGGAVLTETVFGFNGIGKLAINSIGDQDLPVVLGVTLFAAFFIVVANLVVDILYAVVDPRVRLN